MHNIIACDKSEMLLNLTLLTHECKLSKQIVFFKIAVNYTENNFSL